MDSRMILLRRVLGGAALLLALALTASTQESQRSRGGIKGKVRVDGNSTPDKVAVILRRGDEEIKRVETNGKGEFEMRGLEPGLYGLTFRKPGLSVGRMENIEVRAGKVRAIGGDRLFLPVDEGSLAFIRGSVFDRDGRVVPGAHVELARLLPDGSARKVDTRVTTESGFFMFRLRPDPARYRITSRAEGLETTTQQGEVEGAVRTNIAITVPAAK